MKVTEVAGQPGAYDVHGPTGLPLAGGGPQAQAPPGYYMLFLVSDQGAIFHGRYVVGRARGGCAVRRLVAMAAASAVLALSACGPEVENVQKWMLGGKSTWNNMGAPVERSSGTTLSVAEDGTGVAWSLASPARNLHDIYIEPKSEDEFRVLPDYEAFDRRGYTFEHMLKEGEAWRIRRVRDDCGPFRGDTIDLETGEPNGSGGEWWPGTVCVAEVTDPEHCEPPGGPVNCYQYVWCSGTPPPAQACQDRWEEEGTLDPR